MSGSMSAAPALAALALSTPRARVLVDDQTPAVRQMRLGLLLIGLQFIVPALSYVVDPASTVAVVNALNVFFGGARFDETGHLWHMLAVGNVLTLGFLCLLIRSDVERFLPALPALFFLKIVSSLYSLGIGFTGVPVFFAVFVLDGVTAVAMVVLALRAAASLAVDRSAPWWARWLLVHPVAFEQTLARYAAKHPTRPLPNLWQLVVGTCAMWHRIAFRSDTVGTSRDPVLSTWRARLWQFRALRLPVLLTENSIKPFAALGLDATPAVIIHHLLSAHHDVNQCTYDLELLELHDGGLAALRAEVAAVVDGTHPRAAFLRDLCVFAGYHERLLNDVDDALAGASADLWLDDAVARDPDLSLCGCLGWCARQPMPTSTTQALRALLSARFV